MRKFKITVNGTEYEVMVEEVTNEEEESDSEDETKGKKDKKRKKCK